LDWQEGQVATRIDQTPAELGAVGEAVTAMVPHPHSDLLLVGTAAGRIVVWDPGRGEATQTIKAHNGDVTQIIYHHGTNRFLTVSVDGFVQWWNANFQREQGFSAGCALYAAAASPEGRYLAAGGLDKTIRVWDTHSSDLAHTLKGHAGQVSALGWTNEKTLVSGDADGVVRCWEVEVRRCFLARNVHEEHISVILPAPNREWYLTASWDGKVKFWTPKHRLKFELPAGPAPATSATLLPEGKLLAVAYWDGTVAVWDLENARVFEDFRAHEDSLVGCAAIQGGQILATTDQRGKLRSWSLATMGVSRFHNLHSGEVYSVSYTPDNTQALSVSHDGQIKLWDRTEAVEVASLEGHCGPILSSAVSPDRRIWALGTHSGEVRLWNADEQSFEACLIGHKDAVSGIAFLPNGSQMLTASWDMKLKLWSLERSQVVCTLHGHSKEIAALDVSLDGRLAVSASWDMTARLWDLTAHRREYLADMRCLAGHEGRVLDCAFSPDGLLVATASADETVRVWHVEKAKDPRVLHAHRDAATACRFTPDGQLLISTGRDGRVNVSATTSGEILAQLEHDSPILALAVSPDGGQAMIGDEAGRVRFLRLSYQSGANWVAAATSFQDPPIWKRGAPPVEVYEVSCIYCGRSEVLKQTQLGKHWKCPGCGDILMVCPKGMPPSTVDILD
jgi:WD40 repeat protein